MTSAREGWELHNGGSRPYTAAFLSIQRRKKRAKKKRRGTLGGESREETDVEESLESKLLWQNIGIKKRGAKVQLSGRGKLQVPLNQPVEQGSSKQRKRRERGLGP